MEDEELIENLRDEVENLQDEIESIKHDLDTAEDDRADIEHDKENLESELEDVQEALDGIIDLKKPFISFLDKILGIDNVFSFDTLEEARREARYLRDGLIK